MKRMSAVHDLLPRYHYAYFFISIATIHGTFFTMEQSQAPAVPPANIIPSLQDAIIHKIATQIAHNHCDNPLPQTIRASIVDLGIPEEASCLQTKIFTQTINTLLKMPSKTRFALFYHLTDFRNAHRKNPTCNQTDIDYYHALNECIDTRNLDTLLESAKWLSAQRITEEMTARQESVNVEDAIDASGINIEQQARRRLLFMPTVYWLLLSDNKFSLDAKIVFMDGIIQHLHCTPILPFQDFTALDSLKKIITKVQMEGGSLHANMQIILPEEWDIGVTFKPQRTISLLMHAIQNNKSELALRLIHCNADVNYQGKTAYNDTPLHAAAYFSTANVVDLLLQKGALVNAQNDYGRTPLRDAAMGSNTKNISTLLAKGAHVDLPDKQGNTPLMLAAKGIHPKIKPLARLIEAGANINTKNLEGKTALDIALHCSLANHAWQGITDYLMSKGAKRGSEIA